MFCKNNTKRCGLLLLVALMVMVFGLWGCDNGGDGGGVNYGHDFTVTILDNTGGAFGGALGAGDVLVTSETGVVGTINIAGNVITFSVDGITKAQNYVSLDLNITGYIPLLRQYLCTVTSKTDTSGDAFSSRVYTFAQLPAGGAGAESAPVTHSPGTGTAADLTVNGLAPAAGFSLDATVGAGLEVVTPAGGTVNDTISMKATYHTGETSQQSFYPGGSFAGDAPAAFGTISFMGTTSGNTVVPTANTNVALNLTFTITPGASATLESDYAAAIEATYACIIDVSTGQSVNISGCTYDTVTGLYTCANGYYTFNAGDPVGVYRLEGGQCPTN